MQPGNDTTLFGINFGPSARPHRHTSGDRSRPVRENLRHPSGGVERVDSSTSHCRKRNSSRTLCRLSRLLNQFAVPDEAGLKRLKDAMNRFHLSARAYDRILKVARTIADLEGSEGVQVQHINEAVNYRNLDRENWGDR